MILVLDLDRTLNRLFPDWVRSIRDLAPAPLRSENGRALWDWLIAHLTSVEYPPQQAALEALAPLCAEASAVVINTGRPEALREVSQRWLARFLRVDGLWMRADDDFRPTAEVKRDNLELLLRSYTGDDVFAFDDNQAAVTAYRRAGINALWAPRCWDELLAAIADRAAHESAADILRRCAEGSLRDLGEVHRIDHQDSGPAGVKTDYGNRGASNLDAQGEVDRDSQAVRNHGSNHVAVGDDRD
jgi:beta-phosphoglucomutase-like phosphatase (HAD superfamily)